MEFPFSRKIRESNVRIHFTVFSCCVQLLHKILAHTYVGGKFKGLGGFQRLKTGTFLQFFKNIFSEIFYSNSLPYKRYIFDKYIVKFLLKNIENSVIGTSSPVTLQRKVPSA